MSSLLFAGVLGCSTAVGCASSAHADGSGSTARMDPGDPLGDGGGVATGVDASPLAVVLPVPGDRDLGEADQAHVVHLAPRAGGGVAAIVVRRDGFGAFQPAGGVDIANTRALVVVDGAGAVQWTRPVGRAARVIAMPDGSVVVGDLDGFRQLDANGNLVREALFGANFHGLARLGSGTVVAVTMVTADTAPLYGFDRAAVFLFDVFGGKRIGSEFGDVRTASGIDVDGKGVGWTSSLRIDLDGRARAIGVPRWANVTGKRAGGAYVTFIVGSEGCPSSCDAAIAELGEGTYRAELDASGAIAAIEENVIAYDLLVEHEGVLWTSNGTPRAGKYVLSVGPSDRSNLLASTENVAPAALASGKDGVWVGGGFTGLLRAFGKDLDAGRSQGRPFLVRIPRASALAELAR